jgi:hypothetical protein
MKKILLLTGIVLFSSGLLQAQEGSNKRNKIYETWVKLNDLNPPLYGILYEVRDSSIILSTSNYKYNLATGKFLSPPIHFSEINYVKARRQNSVAIGAIIGGAFGFITPLLALPEKRSGIETGYTVILLSLPLGGLGTGFGALMGYLKRYVPVNGNFEQFAGNESRLKKYSYLNEYSDGLNIYERKYDHKAYIGFTSGISIPFGDFTDKSAGNSNADSALMGGGVNISAGYRINNKLGISASLFNSQYNILSNEDDFWIMTSIVGGPVFSSQVSKKLYFDLKPAIGFGDLSFEEVPYYSTTYRGLVLNISASSTFNFSRRWCLMAEAGYLTSNQKTYDNSLKKIRAANLWLGVGYRFR